MSLRSIPARRRLIRNVLPITQALTIQEGGIEVAVTRSRANFTNLLLTWNIRHIANAHVREDLRVLIATLGYTLPTICTPEDLLPPP